MKNKIKNIIILCCLIIVVVAGVLHAADEFIYEDKGNRDPMWPLVTSNGVIKNYNKDFSVADINIEGIMFEPSGNSYVIIRGNILKEKDTLGPYVVSSIQKDLVVITRGDQKIKLRITKE